MMSQHTIQLGNSFQEIILKQKRGFTLIELLVVIAIIGLLASIVLTGLNSSRIKSRIAAAQRTAEGLHPVLNTCLSAGAAVTIPVETQSPGTAICTGAANYPALPGGWTYCNALSDGGVCAAVTSTQTPNVSYSIVIKGDSKTVTCTETSCITS